MFFLKVIKNFPLAYAIYELGWYVLHIIFFPITDGLTQKAIGNYIADYSLVFLCAAYLYLLCKVGKNFLPTVEIVRD